MINYKEKIVILICIWDACEFLSPSGNIYPFNIYIDSFNCNKVYTCFITLINLFKFQFASIPNSIYLFSIVFVFLFLEILNNNNSI